MRHRIGLIYLLGLLAAITGCENPWDNHLDESNSAKPTQNLLELIDATPELSTFSQWIEDAGAEDMLKISQMTTVWAPTNQAIAEASIDMEGQPEKLMSLLQNHIARGKYPFSPEQELIRCKMMNGKRVPINMSTGSIYDEVIDGDFNHIATNGVLHIIDQTIELRPNIWEFVEETDLDLEQIRFLNSITGEIFVDSLAEQIGFDPVTSEPIYDTLSGTIWYNPFIFNNADVRNEDSIFTFLILEDDVFELQLDRFRPYYKLQANDERDTAEFRRYMVCIDLVASGYRTPEELDRYIISVNGIRVPFDRSAVMESYEASNGVIYHLSSCDLKLSEKFPPVIIEAETEEKFIYTNGGYDGFTRIKPLASGGYDFVLDNHRANPGRTVYHGGMVAAAKYNFYWVAVDDFGGRYSGAVPDSLIHQKLEKVIYIPGAPLENNFPVHRTISDSLLWVVDLSYETAEERYAGSLTFNYYEDFWFHLRGSGNNTTTTLDYVKFVPVFEE